MQSKRQTKCSAKAHSRKPQLIASFDPKWCNRQELKRKQIASLGFPPTHKPHRARVLDRKHSEMRTRTKLSVVAKVRRKIAKCGVTIIFNNLVLCKAAASAAHSMLSMKPYSKRQVQHSLQAETTPQGSPEGKLRAEDDSEANQGEWRLKCLQTWTTRQWTST